MSKLMIIHLFIEIKFNISIYYRFDFELNQPLYAMQSIWFSIGVVLSKTNLEN